LSPTVDQQLFRQTLGQFATGVTVIGFLRQGEICGMTVNSFSSVSLDPPLVLFCPALTTRFALEFVVGESFTVSILSQGQKDVCTHFAGRNHLEREPWLLAEHSPPVVEGCVAWLRCRVVAAHSHGDHLVVVGEVCEFGAHQERLPLLFFRGGYPMLKGVEQGSPSSPQL
jgi:3-hydroxy-9,10-secoandrosta-1,3,5(10)-triene-9,17-dione monooxygenase reductase component